MADHYDDVSQQAEQMTDQAKQLAGKAGSAVGKKAAKLAGKAAKKVAAKGAMLAVKGIGAIISAIISAGVPLLIFIVVITAFVGFVTLVEFDSRTVNQNLQSEEPSQMNTQGDTSSENSMGKVEELSTYNLMVNAFYMNYASQSYYRYYEGELIAPGESKLVQAVAYRSNKTNDRLEEAEKKELKDSTNLESQFLLSHSLLWELDEYLHEKQFKYPESFIKPLYYEEVKVGDKTTFKLKDLIENGELVAKSHVYDKNGKRTDKLTEGVWDYGLAPIISYKTYLKDNRYEYDVVGKSYEYSYTLPKGAVNAGKVISGTQASSLTEADFSTYYKEDEYLPNPEFIHMIDSVTTFVGTFTPQIDYQWSRNPNSSERVAEKTKDKSKTKKYKITFEKWVPKTTSTGLALYSVTANGKVVGEVAEGCFILDRTDPNYHYVMKNTCTDQIIAQSDTPITVEPLQVKKMVTEEIKVEVTEVITYEKYLSSVTPQYRGEPQVSDFKGGQYLRDYIGAYQTHVPETVLTDLDLKNRMDQDPDKLQEIIDQYNAMQQSGSISTEAGKEVGKYYQSSYDAAHRYLSYFKKYGKMYGVDPYLLLAKAAQESSGDHESNLVGGAAVGIMQIERPGRTDGTGVSQVTAYNFETKKKEVVKICEGDSNTPSGCLNVYNLENNIRVGAMQLAQRYKVFKGHHMLALQSYNFGEGGARTTVRTCGFDPDQVMKDQYDLDWMACRQTIHDDPSLVNRPDLKTYGDPVYIENVLKYYQNPETNNYLVYTDENGTVHQFDTSKISTTGTGGSSFSTSAFNTGSSGSLLNSLGKFFKVQFDNIVTSIGSFFHEAPKHFGHPESGTVPFEPSLTVSDVDTLERMIFAMEDQTPISQSEKVTDDLWKERYSAIFSSLGSSSNDHFFGADPYFGGAARTPLPFETSPVLAHSYRSMIQGSHNYGVAYSVTPNTNIHAIYDGTVIFVGNEGGFKHYTVKIQHHNGLVSSYSNLDESTVSLKEGDAIRRGGVIGKVADTKNVNQQLFCFELRQDGIPVNPTFLFNSNGSGGGYYVPESSGGFIIPLATGYVSCEFGCYVDKYGVPHNGIDLANNGNTTTPVIASAAGTVVVSGWHNSYGNYVIINHSLNNKAFATLYAHMHHRPLVIKGQMVTQGQQLGFMGNTGNSFGAHLHFELYEGKYNYPHSVNPRNYINFPSRW